MDTKNTALPAILWTTGILVIGCGLIALAIVYLFGKPYFEPKVQIILKPDSSHVSTVNPADLDTAARILVARCRRFGYSGISFGVAENNQILANIPVSVEVESFIQRTTDVGLLELVDFGETPIPPSTTITTDFGHNYFAAEGTTWHTVMTNSDFESANVTRDQLGGYQISFILTPNGTKTLANYTTNNSGHYLGVVLDKVVLSSPRVAASLTEGSGVIAGNFTQETAENLAVYLKEGPLPIRLIVKDVVLPH
jgi:hypothetical protein